MTSVETPGTVNCVDTLLSQGHRLSFSATVARQLVHRRAVSEVLLTDWCRAGTDVFVCAAQWSRSHRLYRVRDGRHDPLLLAETIRQVGLLLCHEAYQVPFDHSFLMDRIAYDADLYRLVAGAVPAEIVLAVRARELRRRTRSAWSLRFDVEFFRGKGPIGRGAGWVSCVEPVLYERLRPKHPEATPGAQRPAPVSPAEVGLVEAEDVVLGRCWQPAQWPLRVLTEHPVLFDHPLDHVPGMLVLESVRQASRAVLAWPNAQLTACDMAFFRFIELGELSFVCADVQKRSKFRATVLMLIVQAGHAAARGTVTANSCCDDTAPTVSPP